jgi:hypothetical protein
MRTLLKTIAASAFVGLLGMATQASAVNITVAEEGGWVSSDSLLDVLSDTPPPSNIPPPVDGTSGRFTTASWFAGTTPQSTLRLDFFALTLDVPDTGAPVDFLIARITQGNEPLPAGTVPTPYIHTLSFAAEFRILNADAGDDELFADSPTGDIRHTETRNSAPCNQDGSLNAVGSICDDIFGFTLDLAAPVPFVIDGVKYAFDFAIVPGPGTVFGADSRVYTGEGEARSIDVVVTIRALPEPGTVALLAVALIGLAFVGRRTRA